jgi:hypothetical protein
MYILVRMGVHRDGLVLELEQYLEATTAEWDAASFFTTHMSENNGVKYYIHFIQKFSLKVNWKSWLYLVVRGAFC